MVIVVKSYEPPRFRPLSRSAPIGFQRRREPAPLMFSSTGNKFRLRDQFKATTSNMPMKTYKVQFPRGSSTRIMPMYLSSGGGNRLQPLTTVSPSPTIIVKPVLNTKPGAILTPLPLTSNPATYIKLTSRPKEQLNLNSNKNAHYTYEKPGSSVNARFLKHTLFYFTNELYFFRLKVLKSSR